MSKPLKSKGTPARDPEKARTRQEKKTYLKKMEINTFTWEKNVTEYFCKSFDGICFCPVLSLRSRSHYAEESLNTAFSFWRNINCSVHYVHSTLKTQQSPVILDLFWENSATKITWLSRGHCLIGFLSAAKLVSLRSSGLKSVFEKRAVRFRDGVVWTVIQFSNFPSVL